VEGYASVAGPKIEVVRKERSQELRCNEDELIAVATDIPDFKVDVPVLDLNQPEAVIDFIFHWLRGQK